MDATSIVEVWLGKNVRHKTDDFSESMGMVTDVMIGLSKVVLRVQWNREHFNDYYPEELRLAARINQQTKGNQ